MLGWRLGCAVRWTSWLPMDELRAEGCVHMTCNPRCQHEFCWLCPYGWTSATHDASEASHSEVLASVKVASKPAEEIEEEIKTHNVSEFVAISQKTHVTLPEPNASGYDSDNCATSAWGLDRIDSVDTSFNNECEWESDFPDGGVGANVYAFDAGIKVNNGDFGGKAIIRYSCLSLCAEPTATVPMSQGLWRAISMASSNMQPSTGCR